MYSGLKDWSWKTSVVFCQRSLAAKLESPFCLPFNRKLLTRGIVGGRSADSSSVSCPSCHSRPKPILVWGINILCVYLEWLNPVVERREEFIFVSHPASAQYFSCCCPGDRHHPRFCLHARSCLFDLGNQSVMLLFISKIIA